jgi:hypothetical protein
VESDAASFERIDYSLRPAKSTERWMLVEGLARLAVFAPLSDYRYVGFGSPFFVDFRLFHRRLAIVDMISIEERQDLESRFGLNKPFDCIRMKYGNSAEVLPELDWSPPLIVWLDYDNPLRVAELADVERVVERAKHGDCLVVTVDAQEPSTEEDVEKIREDLGRLAGSLGSPESLSGWALAELYYDLLNETLQDAARDRGDKLAWHQLFHFHYKDSARMLTVGGIFVDGKRSAQLDEAEFGNLPFVVEHGNPPFPILMPQLTLIETGRIDKHMPDRVSEAVRSLAKVGVRREQVQRYARVYRHAPSFHETQA